MGGEGGGGRGEGGGGRGRCNECNERRVRGASSVINILQT